jgi:hypothetical protein
METALRKLLTFLIALGAIVFAVAAPSHAAWIKSAQPFELYLQPVGGVFLFVNRPTSTYVGPGNISLGGATANVKVYISCARVLNTAKATTATPMCDLVDSAAPTTILCTLHGTPSGFVDLSTAGCGGTTPAALCAARTGGVCNILTAHDQSGSGLFGDFTQTTAADQPFLTFSALNGLPSITCTTTVQCILSSTVAGTLAPPFSISAVGVHGNSTVPGPILAAGTSTTEMAWNGLNPSTLTCEGSSGIVGTSSDTAFQGMTCQYGTSASVNINGASVATGSTGTGGFSAEALRIFRSQGGIHQGQGQILELMINAAQTTSTDLNNLFVNMNGPNGYNGGL